MKYEFHPEAEWELYEAAAFYEAGLSGLGRDFADEVERVTNILLEHRDLGARVDENLRHFVLRRFHSRLCTLQRRTSRDNVCYPRSNRLPSGRLA